tara:strand:+ start:658 stop:897 length:240 start_codon:yes stop_codon:yes gene_type:complete
MAYNKKKDKKYRVIQGFTMYPPYLDGRVDGDIAYDRYGNWMSYEDRTKMYQRKKKEREDWRKNNPNIINKRDDNTEEDV